MTISVALLRSSAEGLRRWDAWKHLGQPDRDTKVGPRDLRRVRLYGGAQGVWVDKGTTASGEFVDGIAVSVLHTDSHYPDEFSEEGARYHYPDTDRVGSRYSGEIEAVKNCQKSALPVLVITRPTPNSASRLCRWAWVEDWNDSAQEFFLSFSRRPAHPDVQDVSFNPTAASRARRSLTKVRPGQSRFRFLVEKRYGAECVVCGLRVRAMLQAAHIVPKEFDGTDDPRNGLMLCANHHAAFDANLFAIDPALDLWPGTGNTLSGLQISRHNLQHLGNRPATEALKIRCSAHPASLPGNVGPPRAL